MHEVKIVTQILKPPRMELVVATVQICLVKP